MGRVKRKFPTHRELLDAYADGDDRFDWVYAWAMRSAAAKRGWQTRRGGSPTKPSYLSQLYDAGMALARRKELK